MGRSPTQCRVRPGAETRSPPEQVFADYHDAKPRARVRLVPGDSANGGATPTLNRIDTIEPADRRWLSHMPGRSADTGCVAPQWTSALNCLVVGFLRWNREPMCGTHDGSKKRNRINAGTPGTPEPAFHIKMWSEKSICSSCCLSSYSW